MNNLQQLLQEIVETSFGIPYLGLDIRPFLKKLEERNSSLVKVHNTFGCSEEGYPIYVIEVGHSEKRLVSFGRIHGDEESTTLGILETASFLTSDKKLAKRLLEKCSFVGVPLVNPDGAHKSQRYNSKNIDINRDFGRYFIFFGSNLKSKESNAVKNILEHFKPSYILDHHDAYGRASTVFGNKGNDDLKNMAETSVVDVMKKKGYDAFYKKLDSRAASAGQLVNYSSKRHCSSTIVEVGYSSSSLMQRRVDMHAGSDLVTMTIIGYL